ncbi:Oidioi.mRNA.OKI2018_I69.PAR.g13076.t1.cds [Oikopleura dioica]|uniref:Oidioi.mRNA.OKI2018_I69.PAR.g13076.t1.cds n=1 Tax=Oikopleura dioica TaxID=34765 RepID=A0ABN7S334_OIKDI|nr:Oidioi.mRNA.OKI2018_I69.PAR.g13076.t1.cds [Oikopleura dioica]
MFPLNLHPVINFGDKTNKPNSSTVVDSTIVSTRSGDKMTNPTSDPAQQTTNVDTEIASMFSNWSRQQIIAVSAGITGVIIFLVLLGFLIRKKAVRIRAFALTIRRRWENYVFDLRVSLANRLLYEQNVEMTENNERDQRTDDDLTTEDDRPCWNWT